MGNKKRIAINMIAQIISFSVNIGINFWLTPFITQNVGKEVYGFVNLAFQVTGYVTIITVALNTMLGRYVTIKLSQNDTKNAKTYFTSVTLVNMAIALFLVLPTVFLILFLNSIINIPQAYILDVKLLWAFIICSFLAGLMFESFGVAVFASNRLDLGARRSIESNILKAVLLVCAYVFFAPHVWYIGLATLISGLFVVATNIVYLKKLTPELRIERKYFRKGAVYELMSVGVWNSVNMLAQNLISGLDMIITNLFIGAAQMTLMGFAKSMPTYILQLIVLVSNSFAPTLTKIYAAGDNQAFVKSVKSTMKVCGFICSVPVIGYAVYGKVFFSLWLPMLSPTELKTVQILTILVISQTIFDVYIYPLYTVNSITCKLKLPVLVSFCIGIGNVAGTLLLLKYTNIGIYSVQLVSSTLLVLRVFLFAPLYSAYLLKQKWFVFYIPLIRGALSTVIMMFVFYKIATLYVIDSWIEFAVIVGISGAIGYFINFWIVLNKNERRSVLNYIARKR